MTNAEPGTGRSPYAARKHDHHNPLAGGKVVPSKALSAAGTPSDVTFLRGDDTWAEIPVAPVAAATEVQAQDPWWHDSWDVTDASVTTYTMTFGALDQAATVELNGLILREGIDYALDYPAGVITLVAGQTTVGDVLGVRYVQDGVGTGPRAPLGGTALLGANAQLLPAGTSAGDTAVIFTAIPASRAINSLNGYTDRGSCTVTHVANTGTYTYTLHILTKVVTSSTDVPTYTGVGSSGGGQDIVWGVYAFPGTVAIADTKTATVADDTTASTPAVTVGASTVRAWVTISNNGTLSPPARGGDFGATEGTDIDITLAVDPDRTASTTTETVTAGWMLATVAIR